MTAFSNSHLGKNHFGGKLGAEPAWKSILVTFWPSLSEAHRETSGSVALSVTNGIALRLGQSRHFRNHNGPASPGIGENFGQQAAVDNNKREFNIRFVLAVRRRRGVFRKL